MEARGLRGESGDGGTDGGGILDANEVVVDAAGFEDGAEVGLDARAELDGLGLVVGGAIDGDADGVEGVASLAAADDGGSDIDGGEASGADEDGGAEVADHAAVVIVERDGIEGGADLEGVGDKVVEILVFEVGHGEDGLGGRGREEAFAGGGLEDDEAELSEVGARDHFLEARGAAIGERGIHFAVEVGLREAIEVAGFDIDGHETACGECGLCDAFGALDVGHVGAGAEDEADVAGVVAGHADAASGEEGGHGVVDDAHRDVASEFGAHGGREAGADHASDDLGGLDLLGPAQEATIAIGGNFGGVGEAESEDAGAIDDGAELFGEGVEEFVGGEVATFGAGHAIFLEIFDAGIAVFVEPDDGCAQVGATRIQDENRAAYGYGAIERDIGRNHGQGGGIFSFQAGIHLAIEFGEKLEGIGGAGKAVLTEEVE